jgi:ribosomal protein L16 Arg81 hydroxylase
MKVFDKPNEQNGACFNFAMARKLGMKFKMEKKREYSHEDMEALGSEIEVLRQRARHVDHDIRNGVISHEQWVTAAQELMERKKEILEILADVDRYKMDLRKEIQKEKDLLQKAEERIATLEARNKNGKI